MLLAYLNVFGKKETIIQNIPSGIETLSIWNRKSRVYTEVEEISLILIR